MHCPILCKLITVNCKLISKRPRWIVACNFAEWRIYDMERPAGEPDVVRLEDLPKECYRLKFLVDEKSENIRKEIEVSLKAGSLVGRLYDALLSQYRDPASAEAFSARIAALHSRVPPLLRLKNGEFSTCHIANMRESHTANMRGLAEYSF